MIKTKMSAITRQDEFLRNQKRM